jgi:oxygen-dependent protoporphyrinogen oxidase
MRVLMEPFVGKRTPSPYEGEGQGEGKTVEPSSSPSPLSGRRDNRSDESVASFVRRRLGDEALAWLAQPLLAGIYGADPETLSLRATFPRFLEMEEKHGGVLRGLWGHKDGAYQASGARYGLFVSLRGGMQTLVDRLEKKMMDSQVVIQKNAAVQELHRNPAAGKAQWSIVLGDRSSLEADAVCLALSSDAAARLLCPSDAELASLLDGIPSTGSATINLAFRRSDISHSLSGFGFVVPQIEKRFLLAGTFSHQKFEGRAPEGCVLIRGFVGGAFGEYVLKADDATLERRALQDLHELLGLRDSPLFSMVERHERSLPQYRVGHVERLARIEERRKALPGLALAGNWMRGVGIPDCVDSGERAAKALFPSPSLGEGGRRLSEDGP